jgi:choline-sulfatase
MYNRPAPGNTWQPMNKAFFRCWLKRRLWLNRRTDETIHHSSELYADSAMEHLTHAVPKKTSPFFMYVGFNAPHDPRQA